MSEDIREIGNMNWAVVCGNNYLKPPSNVLYNGAPIGAHAGGTGNNILSINPPHGHEISDWAFSFVAIWDQHLTAVEMKTASAALLEHLATGRSLVSTPAAATEAAPASNTVTTVSGPSVVTTTTVGPCNVTTITYVCNNTTAATTTTTTVSCPPETKA